MKAEPLLNERHQLGPDSFVELRVWRVLRPVKGSAHDLRYALAYVVDGVCGPCYDNEAGPGDHGGGHRHTGAVETAYAFTTPASLLADFWKDVDQWKRT